MPTNILFEATVKNGNADVTLRMSKAGGSPDAIYLDNKEWKPLITKRHSTAGSWTNDGLFDQGSINNSSLSFLISEQHENTAWTAYEWNGGLGRIFIGEEGQAFSTYIQVFEGRLSSLRDQGIEGTVALLGSDADLNRELLDLEYAGTGDAEGPAGMKGELKPRAFGVCESVEPKLINAGLQIYQVHGYGAVSEITTIYDFALALDETKRKADQPTYAALAALTLVPGEFATCLAQGMFRLGAQSDKKISADIKAGSPTSVGTIVPQLLTLAGVPLAKQGDFSAFNSVTWNLYQTTGLSIGDAARSALQQAGGDLFADGTGKWQVMDYYAPKAAVALNSDRSTLPLVRDYELLNANNPIFKVRYGYRRCWGVHSANEVSASLTADIDNEAVQDAIDKANQAAADADAAIARLDAMSADGILDRAEKARLVLIFSTESALQSSLQNQATRANVTTERNTLSTKFNAWKTYLEGLSPAYTDTTQDTPIDRTVFNTRSREYFVAKQALVDAMAGRASQTADWQSVTGTGRPQDNATVGAPNGTYVGGVLAENLVFNAAEAKTKADAAAGRIDKIIDNGILDMSEKPGVIADWTYIVNEYDAIRLRAIDRGVSFTAWSDAKNNLASYLGSLDRWDAVTVDTPINRDTFKSRFNDYYTERAKLYALLDSTAKVQEDKAIAGLERIASDGWLSRNEKPAVSIEWSALNDRQNAANQRWTDFGGPSDAATARQNAANAIDPSVSGSLGNYLGSLSPSWFDVNFDTPINATTWGDRWKAAYRAIQIYELALVGNIGGEAKQTIALLKQANEDNLWSVAEKVNDIIPHSTSLESIYNSLMSQSDPFKNESAVSAARTALSTARSNWINYRDGVRPFWNDKTQASNIDRATATQRLYEYEIAIDNISISIGKYVDTRATFAVDRVNAIGSDGLLDRSEKPKAVIDWQALNFEYNALNVKNRDLNYPSIASSSAGAARNKVEPGVAGSLGTYLGDLSQNGTYPAWDNALGDTPINAGTWRTKWVEALSAVAQYRVDLGAIKGDKGADGTSSTPDPTSANVSYANQTITHGWKGPGATLALNAGQTAVIEVNLNLTTSSTVSVYGYIQVFKSTGEYQTNAAGPSAVQVIPGEPNNLYVSGTFQNNSGARQSYTFHGYTLLDPSSGRSLAAGGGSYVNVSK
jgi:hypothetical protein